MPWPKWTCPIDRSALTDAGDALVCPSGHRHPVRNGVPRFVASEGYAAAFGSQWLRYRRTQLDSQSGLTLSADRAARCLGPQLWNHLEGAMLLEAGCGAGRFTEVLVDRGAHVTSIDLSLAVDANVENVPIGDRHRVAQADLAALPFSPQQFDIVFCLGVLQHTPSPEATMTTLFSHVRPGGWLVIDHYVKTWRWYTRTAPLFRLWLRRLPAERGMRATERLVDVFRPMHLRASSRLTRALVNRVSPVTVYDHALPELPSDLQREWALLDTHDSLTDWYKHRRTPDQLRRALADLGATEIWCAAGGNGIEARARRPDAGSIRPAS